MRPSLYVFPILVCLLIGCGPSFVDERPWSLDELEIDVADTSREVGYTNKRAGFFYTESNSRHRTAWQGWHVSSTKLLSDYRIHLDGKLLERSTVDYARVWPHQLTRSYHEGVQETITFLDSTDAIVVTLENVRSATASISLMLDRAPHAVDRSDSQGAPALVLSPFTPEMRSQRPDVPGWIGVTAGAGPATVLDTSMSVGRETSYGLLRRPLDGSTVTFILVAGDSPESVRRELGRLQNRTADAIQARKQRMEELLASSFFRSSNERFDKALAWSKLSMDALLMEQGAKGIFAGLPWFSNYWGRDTFISLPGATLSTGRFEDAKEILRSFARWQNKDPRSPDEGRIPNLVTPTSTAYNTTDATPWFALSLFEYLKYSGDTAFVREMFPVLQLAVEGPMRHRSDPEGFLKHGEAETWMDAVGPEGPWSPRGDRANDIQALWYKQLLVSTSIAEGFGEFDLAERWAIRAQNILAAFQERFVDPAGLQVFDHLNPDGSPDSSFRPNQLFALDAIHDPVIRQRVFRSITERLVYAHGVGSLDPRDDNFHPYHHNAPYSVQDAAYHNGIVWTWLSGEWMRAATSYGKQDLAFIVADNMATQIIDRGGVGTLSELLDAAPRPGKSLPDLSGTFSQAWSLAEFIRTAYQGFLGVSVNATGDQVWLLPQLPREMRSVTFDVRVADDRLRISLSGDETSAHIRLQSLEQKDVVSFNIGWPFENRRGRSGSISIRPGQTVDIELSEDFGSATNEEGDPATMESKVQFLSDFPDLAGMTLAEPIVRPNLRSLRGPNHPLLPNGLIKQVPASLKDIKASSDPAGDDKGTGTYEYPKTQHLKKGSLDILGFAVSADDSLLHMNLRFQALSNPGWHPEYGFQLTFAAIAIDTDGKKGSGRREVGRNAGATLAGGLGFEFIVYVGGGLRVENAAGTVLAEYLPAPGDIVNPLGDEQSASIAFSLPLSLFDAGLRAQLESARFTVLVGAQDDHGGAGIGDFRDVARVAGEWVGGGKNDPRGSNVYDSINLH